MKNSHLLNRLSFALHGLRAAFHNEKSFRTQLMLAVVALIFFTLLQPGLMWWAMIIIMICLVLAAELINTALEHLADHLHPEQHPKIKLVKDCAAAAVLLLSLAAICVALLATASVLF